ncbi:hypothetical protein Tco_0900716 [Tanacetum coccineum]
MDKSSRELLFLSSFLPVIVKETDFTDLNNNKRLAVCLGALFMSSSLATRDNKLFKTMYNFMPLIYHYAAIAMLTPNWYDMSTFHLPHIPLPLRREGMLFLFSNKDTLVAIVCLVGDDDCADDVSTIGTC